MKTRYLIAAALLLLTTIVITAFTFADGDQFEVARQEILLREVGHEVLLYAGDSKSRVMPVKKTAENEYQIQFENQFTFQPDSLVKIISHSLAKNNLAHNYIVNVLDCWGKNVVYGYAMYSNVKDNIVPCRGRKQPKGCYVIDIKFQNKQLITPKNGILLGSIPLMAFIGLLLFRSAKKQKNKVEENEVVAGEFKIGQTLFYPQMRQLVTNGVTAELTVKETKLLYIFASAPNSVIPRARLQKEIWEDEGVIVGRSLDMFISKLRKKLEIEPSVQLVNIHGKGYRLEIKVYQPI